MYGIDEARAQYEALATASKASPVLQCKAQLAAMGREWQRAGALLKDLSDPTLDPNTGQVISYTSDWVITVAGALVGGMLVAAENDKDSDTASVIRTLQRDGQLSVHITHTRSEAGSYVNLTGPGSPVVVHK